nr:hypothetical protein [Edwardsiella ictaluri]
MGLPTALSYLACGMLPLLWLPTLLSGHASALLLGGGTAVSAAAR